MINTATKSSINNQKMSHFIREKIASGEIVPQTLEVTEEGHVLIDKNKDPELYDWAVNG